MFSLRCRPADCLGCLGTSPGWFGCMNEQTIPLQPCLQGKSLFLFQYQPHKYVRVSGQSGEVPSGQKILSLCPTCPEQRGSCSSVRLLVQAHVDKTLWHLHLLQSTAEAPLSKVGNRSKCSHRPLPILG